jgi:hypothetical protein
MYTMFRFAGRVLVFEVTDERRVSLFAQRETKAAVFTLAPLRGAIVAGLPMRDDYMRVCIYMCIYVYIYVYTFM